jgi:GDP-4-dehydro-6-deoxy-D-mannose reductase
MRNILITGAAGFCAKHLISQLKEDGYKCILGVDIHQSSPANASLDDYVQLDVSDKTQITNLVNRFRPDWVFHLAGVRNGATEDIYRVNLMGTIYLLETLRTYSPNARILLVGSAAEYGHVNLSGLPVKETHPCRPISPYGISKHAMTLTGIQYVLQFGMKVVIARPFNIIGSGVSHYEVVGAVLSRIKEALATENNTSIKLGNMSTKRDFIAVNDVVAAYVNMINGRHWGEVFNICSGRPHSIRTIVEMLLSHSPRPIGVEVDSTLVRTSDVEIVYGSWEKANRAFGFEPVTTVEDSLHSAWLYEMGENV